MISSRQLVPAISRFESFGKQRFVIRRQSLPTEEQSPKNRLGDTIEGRPSASNRAIAVISESSRVVATLNSAWTTFFELLDTLSE